MREGGEWREGGELREGGEWREGVYRDMREGRGGREGI